MGEQVKTLQVSAAQMHMRRLPHVHRPGIAVAIHGSFG